MSKVLVIDDEIMITKTLETLIRMMLNYDVYTYNNPNDLLASGILNSVHFDLVISDFMMPDKNGLEVLADIKKIQPNIVPVLLTGYADKENAIKSINDVGLYYYLEKPWDNNELITVIKNGIEKKNLEDTVQEKMIVIEKRNEEISRLYSLLQKDYNTEMGNVVNVVIALANLIEAKDKYTDGHTRRVADLAIEIGKMLNFDGETLRNLEIAAIIHDIGKVAVPDNILNKNGKLSDQEYEAMMIHPELGKKILQPLSPLADSLTYVLHHHEKLDGTGYPMGLVGEEIDMATRVLCVADIFDALYTERPYKAKFSLEKTMSILHEMVDTKKIDKQVVACIQALIDNEKIYEIY